MNKKEIVVKQTGYNLTSPDQMTKMANLLKAYVVKNKLYSPISGKNYVQVEGWQYAGGLLGLFPMVTEVVNFSQAKNYKYQASVDIINVATGAVVGRGIALCSNEENKKKSFDEYAVMSMAQTRAIGKAYRNLIGWTMKLAGYEGTPAEEMVKVGDKITTPVEVIKEVKEKYQPDGVVCQGCDIIIPQNVADFSKKVFKKNLCRDCQADAKKK